MGRILRLVVALAALMVLATPAAADNASITASDFMFTPSTVTVHVGDTVSWSNGGGAHNVRFDDGSFNEPADPSVLPWQVSRRFDQPGTFRFYCENHGTAGGYGMAGRVVVQGDDTQVPTISGLKVKPKRFCKRKTSRCPKPGAKIVLTLSEPADVEISIESKDDPYGSSQTFTRRGKKGSNSFKYSGKKLALGAYRVTVVATDDSGNPSKPAKASLRVASSR